MGTSPVVPRGPLANSYPGAVGLVVCSLIPYLALTAGVIPLADVITASLHLSSSTFDVTLALSTGAYAAGTVLAVQFAVHLPARRMLVLYEAMFVAASVLAAWAPDGAVWIGAFIAQGLCTSLMLIAAVPPLIVSWPAKKMPVTGVVMNLCVFGAVAIGPTVGALQLDGHAWRPLFWAVAAIAAAALAFSLLTFEDDPPQDHDAPWDLMAVGLAVAGCAAAFFGAGELQAGGSADAVSLVPLITGTVMIVVLVVYEYRLRRPLMPVKAAATTLPITGVFIALAASASAFGIMELVLDVLKTSSTPAHTALLFLPEFVGALAVAGLFGLLFRTRFTPVLALGGLLLVAASAALLLTVLPGSGAALGVVSGLLGLGVAASVSPALFMAGFSLRAKQLQRVFAMIELMRGVTAFLLAPILIFLSGVLGSSRSSGIEDSVWICGGIALLGFLGGCGLYVSGRKGLQAPDLERWQGDAQEPAWDSPPPLARIRPHRPQHLAGPHEPEHSGAYLADHSHVGGSRE